MRKKPYFGIQWRVLTWIFVILLLVTGYQYWATQRHLQAFFAYEHDMTRLRLANALNGTYRQWLAKTEQLAGLVADLPGLATALRGGQSAAVTRLIASRQTLLHLDDGVTAMAAYGMDGRRLSAWNVPPADEKPLQERAQRVIERQWPDALNVCKSRACTHYTLIPVLAPRGEPAGALLLGFNLDDVLIGFREVSGAGIALLDQPLPHGGIRSEDHLYQEINPKAMQLPVGYRLVARMDVKTERQAVSALQHTLLWLHIILFLAMTTALAVTFWGTLGRLRAFRNALPLLQEKRFADLRDRLAGLRHRFIRDEIDSLIESASLTTRHLEQMDEIQAQAAEAEAARRAAAIVSQQIARSVEAEKRRISRELHDELGQTMVVLRFEAEAIQKASDLEVAKARARGLATTVSQMYEDVNRIIDVLRPEILDTLGLKQGLTSLVNEWGERNPACSYAIHMTGALDDLPDELAVTIFRLIQEALTNTAKHAHASHVRVNLMRVFDAIHVLYGDDGRGFDVEAASWGMGLTGMQQRIAALGGSWKLKSAPGEGTQIRVRLPLPAS